MALVEALHSARLHDHEMFSVHVTSWSCLEQCCVQHFRFAVENLLLSAMIEAFFWGVVVSLTRLSLLWVLRLNSRNVMYSCLFRLFKRAMDSSANRRCVWKKNPWERDRRTTQSLHAVGVIRQDGCASRRKGDRGYWCAGGASETDLVWKWLLFRSWMPSVVAKSGEASIHRRTHFLHVWKFADTLAKRRFQMAKRRCASAAPSCQNAFSGCRPHFPSTGLDPLLPTFSFRLGGRGGGGGREQHAHNAKYAPVSDD